MIEPKSEFDRICEAYIRMADEARYRPQAPGDGCGGISLSEEELNDPERLKEEARDYADRFIGEVEGHSFRIGTPNYRTNRALVFTIEAARLLCAGMPDEHALRLLRMASEEVQSRT